jgi:CheY-like chemotaxis protein
VNTWVNPRRACKAELHQPLLGTHIVVAIRNATERRRLAEALQNAAYHVTAKDNCHDALLACRQFPPVGALVAQLELPDMWGLELARCASQYNRNLIVVCIFASEPKLHMKLELAERGWQWVVKGPSLQGLVLLKVQNPGVAAPLAS